MSKENDSNDNGITRRGFIKNTALAGAGVMLAGSGILGGSKPAMAASSGDAVVDEIYRQAMDFHLHCGPDLIERKYDDLTLAKMCMDTGLTGLHAQVPPHLYRRARVLPPQAFPQDRDLRRHGIEPHLGRGER